MTVAYDKLYLSKAQNTLGRMLDFAVNHLNYDLQEFYQMFLKSRISGLFATGDCTVIAGHSGIELTYKVLEDCCVDFVIDSRANELLQPTVEYWTGLSLAYFQWHSGFSFCKIQSLVPITKIVQLYYPYHEMDILQFVDKMYELCEK